MTFTPFNRAANDSPRSGSTKQAAPLVWCMIVVAVIALATYYAMTI
jgi:hypothetical protein